MTSSKYRIAVNHDTFENYGLKVNFKPGKTEIVMQLRGKITKREKQKDVSNVAENGSMHLKRNSGAEVVLTKAYKHLGSMVSADGNLMHDAQA